MLLCRAAAGVTLIGSDLRNISVLRLASPRRASPRSRFVHATHAQCPNRLQGTTDHPTSADGCRTSLATSSCLLLYTDRTALDTFPLFILLNSAGRQAGLNCKLVSCSPGRSTAHPTSAITKLECLRTSRPLRSLSHHTVIGVNVHSERPVVPDPRSILHLFSQGRLRMRLGRTSHGGSRFT
jgi:hypothetical protein